MEKLKRSKQASLDFQSSVTQRVKKSRPLNQSEWTEYLTIIPRARMGSESFGLMGYWLEGHEGERNNCFSKVQLVGQKYRESKNVS